MAARIPKFAQRLGNSEAGSIAIDALADPVSDHLAVAVGVRTDVVA